MGNQHNSTLNPEYFQSFHPVAAQSDHSLPQFNASSLNQLPPLVSAHLDKEKPFEKQFTNFAYQARIIGKSNYYQGPIDDQNRPSGWGKIIKRDGSLLLGKFQNGEACFGRYILPDGSYYEGSLQNNQISGKGIFIKDHLTYQGQFKDNHFHGSGVLKVGNKYLFQGEFKEGKKVQGSLTWFQDDDDVSSKCTYKGTFDGEELFSGKGVLSNKFGTYNGKFQQGLKHGYGVFKFIKGMVYAGNYIRDRREGDGTLFNAAKGDDNLPTHSQENELICYRGQFENGLPNGEGDVFSKYKGIFVTQEWVDGVCKRLLPNKMMKEKEKQQSMLYIESKESEKKKQKQNSQI